MHKQEGDLQACNANRARSTRAKKNTSNAFKTGNPFQGTSCLGLVYRGFLRALKRCEYQLVMSLILTQTLSLLTADGVRCVLASH